MLFAVGDAQLQQACCAPTACTAWPCTCRWLHLPTFQAYYQFAGLLLVVLPVAFGALAYVNKRPGQVGWQPAVTVYSVQLGQQVAAAVYNLLMVVHLGVKQLPKSCSDSRSAEFATGVAPDAASA